MKARASLFADLKADGPSVVNIVVEAVRVVGNPVTLSVNRSEGSLISPA
jgi:hypothetical protein